LCLGAASLLDELFDARFDDARHTAISKTLGRNVLPLIDGSKHRLAGLKLGDCGPCLEGLASLGHVLTRHDDALGLVLRRLRRNQGNNDAALIEADEPAAGAEFLPVEANELASAQCRRPAQR